MKTLPLAVALAIAAAPLLASAADDQTKKSSDAPTTLSPPPTPSEHDSPLVRAAKATGRLNKKPAFVITNDDLVKVGGHFTTTTMNIPLPPPPRPDAKAEADAALKQALAAADKAKNAEEAKEAAKKAAKARQAAADLYGENAEERVDDPSLQEHMMNQTTSTQAQPANKKPPTE